jgi:hypothetical protein
MGRKLDDSQGGNTNNGGFAETDLTKSVIE